ncbi:MAG: hypothetical protein JXR88_10595 [Clostridia bacterium]|nr:hypothetical protein [Clostridia bacterium]
MKLENKQLDIVVNNEIVHVDLDTQEVTQVKSKEDSIWKRAFKSRLLEHRSKDQICYLVDNEYICVDKF